MKEYKKLQIFKHALQHYIKREGATEKDINQEKKLLDEVTEEVDNMRECYGIK